jgi:L-seryl-tRNA(Ser) seleniumtransferase
VTKASPFPSIDRLATLAGALVARHGRTATVDAARHVLDELRSKDERGMAEGEILRRMAERLRDLSLPSLRPVINLTGTVLHTNLGRAPVAEAAIAAAAEAMRRSVNLEFDLDTGRRGERDDHVRQLLTRLTGAEDATVVNNNAAAVLLVLNSLALRREVPVSRGELIEIGGSFRMPDVMARAGCKLVEVGTTNRTHARDYKAAIGPKTAMIMKVHPSNYAIQGFVAEVPEAELAEIAHDAGLPFVVDLGAGALIDVAPFGLPPEPTVAATVGRGADVVTFSGDKLLGGVQAGFIVGRRDSIAKINRNPLKRALRLDKGRIAAIEATLRLYGDPDRLAERLPALALLTRNERDIAAMGERLLPLAATALHGTAAVTLEVCMSQIGSGAQPMATLPSRCLALRPTGSAKGLGARLDALARRFRRLPVPVIGRIEKDAFRLDLRCLIDEALLIDQLRRLPD